MNDCTGFLRRERNVHSCPEPTCEHNVGKGFARLEDLIVHISQVHTGTGDERCRHNETACYDFVLPTKFQGIDMNAYLDTGASCNIAALEFVNENRLSLHRHKRPKRISAPGGCITSIGTVTARVQFMSKGVRVKQVFEVIENCVHHVILGSEFVRKFDIFRSHMDKLRRVLRGTGPKGLLAVGTRRDDNLVPGTLKGNGVRALADTCADANIISTRLLNSYNIKMDEDTAAQVEFERVDGSRIWSKGIVRDVEWAFAEDGVPHKLDFYVLDDIDYDVILGKDFLFGIDAFNRYPHLLGPKRGPVDVMYVLQWAGGTLSKKFTKLLSKGRGKQQGVSERRRHNQEWEDEHSRRAAVEAWIASLPEECREAAWIEEKKLRR